MSKLYLIAHAKMVCRTVPGRNQTVGAAQQKAMLLAIAAAEEIGEIGATLEKLCSLSGCSSATGWRAIVCLEREGFVTRNGPLVKHRPAHLRVKWERIESVPDDPRGYVQPLPSIERIIQVACSVLRVGGDELFGDTRAIPVVIARAVIVRAARRLTNLSYPEIALAIGRPNHSTCITADQRLTARLAAERGGQIRSVAIGGQEFDVGDVLAAVLKRSRREPVPATNTMKEASL